jgi:hypothetical protein
MPAIKQGLLAGALAGVLLAGCATTPSVALKLDPESAEQRRMQTRKFEGSSEAAVLSAGLGVLQDLGFSIDETESKLGVVSASRKLTSRRPINSQEVGADLLWTSLFPYIAGPMMVYHVAAGTKETQVVRVSLVTQPDQAGTATIRLTAQHRVYKDEKLSRIVKVEPLNDPAFYREFFTRLSKSVFLEEQKI